MKRIQWFAGLGFGIALIAAVAAYYHLKRKHGEANQLIAVAPAAGYDLNAEDIVKFEKLGREGDCEASYKIANYHANVSLKFDDALQWARIAAVCPQVPPKELLISLLSNMQDEQEVRVETENIIGQVDEIDPKEAERLRASFLRDSSLKKPSRTIQGR